MFSFNVCRRSASGTQTTCSQQTAFVHRLIWTSSSGGPILLKCFFPKKKKVLNIKVRRFTEKTVLFTTIF